MTFEELYETYHNFVYSKVESMLSDPQDTEEVVNDIFMRFWGRYGPSDYPDSAELKPLLYTIARNLSIDLLRVRKRHQAGKAAYSKRVPRYTLDKSLEKLGDTEQIAYALSRVKSEKQRSAWVMHHIEGFSYKEIAARENCALSTVKTRVYRANQMMRDAIKRKGGLS